MSCLPHFETNYRTLLLTEMIDVGCAIVQSVSSSHDQFTL